MKRIIRRAILQWISWKSRRNINRSYPWQGEIDIAISQARNSHGKTGKVKELEKMRKDMMTKALAGRV